MRLIRNDYEVDTNSGNVAIRVLIIRKTQQKAGLTDDLLFRVHDFVK